MIEVGRLCLKLAGRDAGKTCVVVEVLDDRHVLVDGETRRRKCNILHLEPLKETLDIKKGASHDTVVKAFSQKGLTAASPKGKKAAARPRAVRGNNASAPKTAPAKAKPVKAKKEENSSPAPAVKPQATAAPKTEEATPKKRAAPKSESKSE